MPSEDNALIELLCNHHRTARGKAKLTRSILLQRTRGKRRRCLLAALAALDLLDREILTRKIVGQLLCLGLTVQCQFFPMCMGDICRECVLPFFQLCLNRPVLLGLERIDLALPITDQTHRHGLDASGGQPLAHLAPKERRQLVAHDAVKHTPRLLGVHLLHVNRARVLHRLLNRRLCDLMKDDPAVLLRIDAENVRQMPCDRLPLTVRIACEIDLIRILRFFFEGADEFPLTAHIDVLRQKVIFDINAELTLRQIAQMPHGGSYNVVLSEMTFDGLRLRRRFHNHQNLFG